MIPPGSFSPSVTAGHVNPDLSPAEPRQFVPSGGYNVNFATQPGAAYAAQRFGGQVNTQDLSGDFGPAGAPSEPIRSVSFPGQPNFTQGSLGAYEVDVPAAQILHWINAGFSDDHIRAMLGLTPNPYGTR